MGLFSNLIKRAVKDEAGKKLSQVGIDIINNIEKLDSSKKDNTKKLTVPRDYMHFPQFDGVIGNLSTKLVDKYGRCTIDYYHVNDVDIEKYISNVQKDGYTKMTNVRYEKNNEYIIIEKNNDSLHLVFHIKR